MNVEISNHGKLSQKGLQDAEVFIPLPDPCNFESEDMSRSADEKIYDFFINQW